MTTRDYINEEIQRDRDARSQALAQHQQVYDQQHAAQAYAQAYGSPGPSEVILLRAKVRELTDQLAAERERCAEIARDYDCLGIRVTRIIARRIRKGVRPLTKAERRELAAGAKDDR